MWGPLITLFLDFWWYLRRTQSLGGSLARLHPPPPVCNESPRVTTGATPANLLTVSITAEPFWSMYLYKHWWDSNPGLNGQHSVRSKLVTIWVIPAQLIFHYLKSPKKFSLDFSLDFLSSHVKSSNINSCIIPHALPEFHVWYYTQLFNIIMND